MLPKHNIKPSVFFVESPPHMWLNPIRLEVAQDASLTALASTLLTKLRVIAPPALFFSTKPFSYLLLVLHSCLLSFSFCDPERQTHRAAHRQRFCVVCPRRKNIGKNRKSEKIHAPRRESYESHSGTCYSPCVVVYEGCSLSEVISPIRCDAINCQCQFFTTSAPANPLAFSFAHSHSSRQPLRQFKLPKY